MIVFELACECGVIFEGWFEGRDDFARQTEEKLLTCPACGSVKVRKVLSPVRSIKPGSLGGETSQVAVAALSEAKSSQILKSLQDYVLNNFEDVGADLAKESLKIRYGLGVPRNLRGVATEAEEEMLGKDGIELIKIPMPVKPKDDA